MPEHAPVAKLTIRVATEQVAAFEAEIQALLASASPAVVSTFLARLGAIEIFDTLVDDNLGPAGTDELRVTVQPSEAFCGLVAALRAGQLNDCTING
jgi:hypothetical protein